MYASGYPEPAATALSFEFLRTSLGPQGIGPDYADVLLKPLGIHLAKTATQRLFGAIVYELGTEEAHNHAS